MSSPLKAKVHVDLTSCDTEQINLIGAIQPHGALIAVSADDLTITHFSANIPDYFPHLTANDILRRPLSDVLGAEAVVEMTGLSLEPTRPEVFRPWYPWIVNAGLTGQPYECLPHRHDGQIILEFLKREKPDRTPDSEDQIHRVLMSELVRPGGLKELARTSAKLVRMVTGFDRVMIYRFAEDKHGEVIAESTSRDDSFLGLHYPASDIPEPARHHFFLNVTRLIPSVSAASVPIIQDRSSKHQLDLTYSKLRAVSPVHVEYLGNMGVDASMSISLVSVDGLWGLIACHHYGPKYINSSQIRTCEFLGATISALLQSLESTALLSKSIRAEKISADLEQEAQRTPRVIDTIMNDADSILELAGAQGMVVQIGGERREIGITPSQSLDVSPLRQHLEDGIVTSANMSSLLALTPEQEADAAGAVYMELSDDGADHILLLRQEFEHTINWAGKPEKSTERLEDGTLRLSPRGSFALWREERRGQSQPFDEGDREALRILRRTLFALNSVERERTALRYKRSAEMEQAKLRVALLDAARMASMGELASALAHELTQPLSAVVNYINASEQELKNHTKVVPPHITALMGSAVEEARRAADLVRRLRNFIVKGDLVIEKFDLHKVIEDSITLAASHQNRDDLEVHYDFETDLPHVWADRVQISLVLLNLARNSLTAMEGTAKPSISARTRRHGNLVEVAVCDVGTGIPDGLREEIFEPFHTSTTNGMGLGLSLCRSIVEAHSGKIWVSRVEMGQGTDITFTIPMGSKGHGKT